MLHQDPAYSTFSKLATAWTCPFTFIPTLMADCRRHGPPNEHSEKHESSIRVSRDLFSNVIDSSVDRAKQDSARISTLPGMMIDFHEHFEKHESSIRISLDSFSKVIDSTFDSAKHDFAKISIAFGTITD
jgi:hypothetical protein